MSKRTILVIGAHQDDCEIGAGGLIARASRKGHRVVLVSTNSGYSTFSDWSVTKGREQDFIEKIEAKAKEMGVEKRLLGYRDTDVLTDPEATKRLTRELAEIVLELRPDIVLLHNRFESSPPDHGTVGQVSEWAARLANVILGGKDVKYRGERYAYEIYLRPSPPTPLFQPDIYVDISDVIREAVDGPNYFGQLYVEYTATGPGIGARVKINYLEEELCLNHYGEMKLTIAKYRGFQCGVRYAEAYVALDKIVLGRRILSEICSVAKQ